MMRWLKITFALLLAVSGARAFEFVTPNGAASGRAIHLPEPGPGDLINLPIGAPAEKWWRIETGFGRVYDLAELDQVFVSGGYRYKNATIAFGYSQFGQTGLYTEKLAKGSVSYGPPNLSAGFSLSYLALGFGGGYSSLNAGSFGLGGGWKAARWHLAVAADDLNSPTFTVSDPPRKPRYSLHGEYAAGKTNSLHGRATFQHDEPPQFGVGQRIAVGRSSALRWGFATSPFTLGGGLELGIKNGRLIYSASYHPVLGLTQMLSLSYGSAMTRPEGNDGLR